MPGRPRPAALGCLAFALALAAAPSARAGDNLDVRAWLGRAGVKLLAVEFYATWCQPCMEAVPRWGKLHRRYQEKGLRLVVVNTRDPDAGCQALPWNPDGQVCDYEGVVDQRFGVGGNLPSAFLWSWQGNLLVQRGHVEEVEAAVRDYLRKAPRVVVDARNTKGRKDEGLRSLVQAELSRQGKLTVVVRERERRRLRKLKKDSFGLSRREDQQCAAGAEVSANSVLVAKKIKAGKRKLLFVGLQSVESGCQSASVSVRWRKRHPARSVAEAVDGLLAKLRRDDVQLPGAKAAAVARRPAPAAAVPIGEALPARRSMALRQDHTVRFATEPAGASVYVDEVYQCDTPCQRDLAEGGHTLVIKQPGYAPVDRRFRVREGTVVQETLEPIFGWISVRSEPSGLPVKVDGKPRGKTPLERFQVPEGRYEVLVTSPRHYDAGERVEVRRGRVAEVAVELRPKLGGLKVRAADQRGNALNLPVWVDREEVGETPWAGEVVIGPHEVVVHRQRRVVRVEEGKVRTVEYEVMRAAPPDATPPPPEPQASEEDWPEEERPEVARPARPAPRPTPPPAPGRPADPWLTGGLAAGAVALAAGAGLLEWMAGSARDEAAEFDALGDEWMVHPGPDRAASEREASVLYEDAEGKLATASALRVAAVVSGVLAVAAAGAAGYLWLAEPARAGSGGVAAPAGLAPLLLAGPKGVHAGVTVRF